MTLTIYNNKPAVVVIERRSPLILRPQYAPGVLGSMLLAHSFPGLLAIGLGVQPFPFPRAMTILRVLAACDPVLVPVGSPIIFDIRLNGASIFGVNKPQILAGESLGVPVVPDVTAIPANSIVYDDIIAVGSGYAGANATLALEVV